MKGYIGKYCAAIAKALGENLKHNKYQVRKVTLITLSRLLVTEGAGNNLEHLLNGIKTSLSDPKIEVRKTAFDSIGYLLKYLAPKYLKQFEANLVSLLLIGLSDES